MALIVGNATVATGMSPVVEGALYADEIFIDGMTFTSKFDIGSAGQIQVEKYNASAVTPRTPGSNFVDEEYANQVININVNNSFQKSTKVPMYYEATMPPAVLANKVWDTTEAVRAGRQASGLAALQDKYGVVSDFATPIAEATIKSELIADRAKLRGLHAHPDVVLCSAAMYATVLSYAGKDFLPGLNDEMARTGRVGYWLGMLFVECTQLGTGTPLVYIGADGVTKSIDNNSPYIMYDHNAFSIIDKLTLLRVIDSELFAGSKVQEEVDTGFEVTNSSCVLARQGEGRTIDIDDNPEDSGETTVTP